MYVCYRSEKPETKITDGHSLSGLTVRCTKAIYLAEMYVYASIFLLVITTTSTSVAVRNDCSNVPVRTLASTLPLRVAGTKCCPVLSVRGDSCPVYG